MVKEGSAEATIRDIQRKTRRKYSTEEKIRIVIEGLRGEQSIAELCRREGIAKSVYYSWSKEFMEAGKARLAGNTKRQAGSSEMACWCARSAARWCRCRKKRNTSSGRGAVHRARTTNGG
jgi:transposase